MNDFINNSLVQSYISSNSFGQLLGMDFEIIGPGDIIYKMLVTEDHLATPIAVHGGYISSLMDARWVSTLSRVMAYNCVVSTIEMKISFITPCFIGDQLSATASMVKASKRLLFIEGKILIKMGN